MDDFIRLSITPLYAHIVTILDTVSLFSCAVHFWVELEARLLQTD
jgi:hypothetical protein